MARRGHGEGSVYKRADGRWAGTVDLGWVNGKRRRKTVYGQTQRDVLARLRKVERHVEAGQAPPSETVIRRRRIACTLTSDRTTETPRSSDCPRWAPRERT